MREAARQGGRWVAINEAAVDELTLVPGIGAGRALQIVEMRQTQRFRTWRGFRG